MSWVHFAKRWKIIWPERLDSRERPKLGPYWKSQPATCKGKYGEEIRIESVNKDNSHSWVRISHGLNKLVTDLSDKEDDDNEQETSEMQFEEFSLETNVLAFASRSKAKAKPRKTYFCQLVHKNSTHWRKNLDRKWARRLFAHRLPSVDTTEYASYLPREDDGAIEVWRLKRLSSEPFCVLCHHWSAEKWKSTMAKGWGNKKRFQYCTDPSGQEILYLRALQGHSGPYLIESSLQDNVLIPNDFFEYIYHIGCAINLHSIMNSGLIPGGQNLSKRQTVFFLPVDPMNKEHKRSWYDRPGSTASCTVQAENVEETSKHGVLGRHQTCSRERIYVLSGHDRTPSSFTTHSQLIVSRRLSRWKLEKSYTRKYMRHPRPPPKISFKDNWMKDLGSEVAGDGENSNKPNQKTTNPIVRTGRPVSTEQPSSSSAQEINKRFLFDCVSTNERTGRPVNTCVPVSVERFR